MQARILANGGIVGARKKAMQTEKDSHFLRLLDQEIVERERELDECQRKLAILRDLRQNYISASARKGDQPSYRLTSNWRTAIEAALAFLREQTGPVSTVCILDHLNNVGIVLGGHQPRNSLSVMLSRSPLFKAHGRRGWTLAELARSPPFAVDQAKALEPAFVFHER